jgi:hypothetical protein
MSAHMETVLVLWFYCEHTSYILILLSLANYEMLRLRCASHRVDTLMIFDWQIECRWLNKYEGLPASRAPTDEHDTVYYIIVVLYLYASCGHCIVWLCMANKFECNRHKILC